jgi:hypothetical protein
VEEYEDEDEDEDDEEEEYEDEPEPVPAPVPAPAIALPPPPPPPPPKPQPVPEPDTSKPFLERFKTYVGCKHILVEDTKIERDDDSPPCLKAFERGNCPACGGSVRQGKQPQDDDRIEYEEPLLPPQQNISAARVCLTRF